MTTATRTRYAGHRFPPEIISQAVWLYFRFPLSLRMVEEMLAARGILVSHETVRQWARKFGQAFTNQIRCRLPCVGDTSVKTHLNLQHFLNCKPDRPDMLRDAAAAANADSSLRSRRQVLESGLVSPSCNPLKILRKRCANARWETSGTWTKCV